MSNSDFTMSTGSFGVGAVSLVGLGASALVGGAFEGLARARAQAYDDDAVEAVRSWMVECGHLVAENAELKAEAARLKGDLRTVGDVLRRTNAALARHRH
jgi:hypothetical protein